LRNTQPFVFTTGNAEILFLSKIRRFIIINTNFDASHGDACRAKKRWTKSIFNAADSDDDDSSSSNSQTAQSLTTDRPQVVELPNGTKIELQNVVNDQIMTLERMRMLLAILLKRISPPNRLRKLGYGTRLIHIVLVKSIESSGRKPVVDKTLDTRTLLKKNIEILLDFSFAVRKGFAYRETMFWHSGNAVCHYHLNFHSFIQKKITNSLTNKIVILSRNKNGVEFGLSIARNYC